MADTRMFDHGQLVGYEPEEKKLIVTLEEEMAKVMREHGWSIHHDKDLGSFLIIQNVEEPQEV